MKQRENRWVGIDIMSFTVTPSGDPDPVLGSVTHIVNTTFTDQLERKRKLRHVYEICCTIQRTVITAL